MVKIKEKNSKMKKDFKRIGIAFIIIRYFLDFFYTAEFSTHPDDRGQCVSYTARYFTMVLILIDSYVIDRGSNDGLVRIRLK